MSEVIILWLMRTSSGSGETGSILLFTISHTHFTDYTNIEYSMDKFYLIFHNEFKLFNYLSNYIDAYKTTKNLLLP